MHAHILYIYVCTCNMFIWLYIRVYMYTYRKYCIMWAITFVKYLKYPISRYHNGRSSIAPIEHYIHVCMYVCIKYARNSSCNNIYRSKIIGLLANVKMVGLLKYDSECIFKTTDDMILIFIFMAIQWNCLLFKSDTIVRVLGMLYMYIYIHTHMYRYAVSVVTNIYGCEMALLYGLFLAYPLFCALGMCYIAEDPSQQNFLSSRLSFCRPWSTMLESD